MMQQLQQQISKLEQEHYSLHVESMLQELQKEMMSC